MSKGLPYYSERLLALRSVLDGLLGEMQQETASTPRKRRKNEENARFGKNT
jgi:hypothetical protein